MTAKRRDNHSTEFGLWLRNQTVVNETCDYCGSTIIKSGEPLRIDDPICSGLGYIATNIDYLWRNYKTGQWMLIEEKRYNSTVKRWQKELFDLLNWCAKYHPKYRGFHTIVFEKTSPEDGKIYLDGNEIIRSELVDFLRMDTTP